MSKLLITTRADEGVAAFSDITHPIFKNYASKVSADFMVLDHTTDCHDGDGRWHYRIMKHYELHEKYDRILHLDTDMLLLPSCPNLFEEVPEDSIGSIYEDVGSREPVRKDVINQVQQKYGDIGWREGYINTGTFLTSKQHRDIYRKIDNYYWVGWGYDDAHMGYLIKKNKFKVCQLSYKYNHMAMFNEPWFGMPDRFDSHIIHYAGRGVFESGIGSKLHQLQSDYKKVYS
jgi:lipopolysaccharide biosynthesis glycosyltransferase